MLFFIESPGGKMLKLLTIFILCTGSLYGQKDPRIYPTRLELKNGMEPQEPQTLSVYFKNDSARILQGPEANVFINGKSYKGQLYGPLGDSLYSGYSIRTHEEGALTISLAPHTLKHCQITKVSVMLPIIGVGNSQQWAQSIVDNFFIQNVDFDSPCTHQ